MKLLILKNGNLMKGIFSFFLFDLDEEKTISQIVCSAKIKLSTWQNWLKQEAHLFFKADIQLKNFEWWWWWYETKIAQLILNEKWKNKFKQTHTWRMYEHNRI